MQHVTLQSILFKNKLILQQDCFSESTSPEPAEGVGD